jgi:hypothetical protein
MMSHNMLDSTLQSISEDADINAPYTAVWALLMDWGAIIDWMPEDNIRTLRMEGSGVGAIRHLITGKGVHLSERLDRADESNGVLELSLVGQLPWGLTSYRARGKVDRLPGRRSRLSWQSWFEVIERGPESTQLAKLLRHSYRMMFLGIRNRVE